MANRFMATKKTMAPFLEIREALMRLRLLKGGKQAKSHLSHQSIPLSTI